MTSYHFVPDTFGLAWTIDPVVPEGTYFTLAEMQRYVEGYIETLYPIEPNRTIAVGPDPEHATEINADDFCIFGNEEARLTEGEHMVFNFVVSNWLGHDIVGPVIAICHAHDPEYGKPNPDEELPEDLLEPLRASDLEEDRL
jgi:hypothetical protein